MTLVRRSLLWGAAAALALAPSALAAESAAELVACEAALATADGKRAMLVFHASWCSWCRYMDAMLEDPAAAKLLAPHFRIVHLRALERDEAERAKQLAGADDVFASYEGAGLPFVAVLDAEAKAVVTSSVSGENFGFPVKHYELDAFEDMLEAAAPAMPAEERAALRAICVRVLEA